MTQVTGTPFFGQNFGDFWVILGLRISDMFLASSWIHRSFMEFSDVLTQKRNQRVVDSDG